MEMLEKLRAAFASSAAPFPEVIITRWTQEIEQFLTADDEWVTVRTAIASMTFVDHELKHAFGSWTAYVVNRGGWWIVDSLSWNR